MKTQEERKRITRRIYYLSKRAYVSNYMTKVKFVRTFVMKSHTEKKFLPKRTKKAVEELMKYNCRIEYQIS